MWNRRVEWRTYSDGASFLWLYLVSVSATLTPSRLPRGCARFVPSKIGQNKPDAFLALVFLSPITKYNRTCWVYALYAEMLGGKQKTEILRYGLASLISKKSRGNTEGVKTPFVRTGCKYPEYSGSVLAVLRRQLMKSWSVWWQGKGTLISTLQPELYQTVPLFFNSGLFLGCFTPLVKKQKQKQGRVFQTFLKSRSRSSKWVWMYAMHVYRHAQFE